MTIDASFLGSEGQQWVNKVASAFGVDDQAASAAVQGLVGELKARIERTMLSRGGVADVAALVTKPSAGAALSNGTNLADPSVATQGNGILDVLIGNKHISRGIAARVASQSGLDTPTVEHMLPAIASVLIGELQRQSAPALQKLARDVPGLVSAGGSPLSLPEGLPSANTPPVDSDPPPRPNGVSPSPRGPVDAGGPLPVPGDNIPGLGRSRAPQREPDPEPDNPYQRLPDIVRRGGGPSTPDGGSLEDIIRSIFGSLLGSNRGVIGTMIQLFLVRWIASFIRRMLGGAIGGR